VDDLPVFFSALFLLFFWCISGVLLHYRRFIPAYTSVTTPIGSGGKRKEKRGSDNSVAPQKRKNSRRNAVFHSMKSIKGFVKKIRYL